MCTNQEFFGDVGADVADVEGAHVALVLQVVHHGRQLGGEAKGATNLLGTLLRCHFS